MHIYRDCLELRSVLFLHDFNGNVSTVVLFALSYDVYFNHIMSTERREK